MLIRPATIADALAISELVHRNSRETLLPHYSPEQWAVFVQYYSLAAVEEKIRTQDVFVAIIDNEMVGTIALEDDMVLGFYTHPAHMGKGIGTAVLNHLEQHARAKGLDHLQLAASPVAVSFYEERGWQRLGEEWFVYGGVRFWETRMRKELG